MCHPLISDFLLASEALSDRDAARIAGVGVATMRRWRVSPPNHLRGGIYRRLTRALESPDWVPPIPLPTPAATGLAQPAEMPAPAPDPGGDGACRAVAFARAGKAARRGRTE